MLASPHNFNRFSLMLAVLSCIAVDHHPPSLVAAVVICVLGSLLTMRLFNRVRNTRGTTRASWTVLTSIIGGHRSGPRISSR